MNLRQKEWEKTFDAIDDWICIIDLKSKILRSNRIGEKLFGLKIQEIIGQQCCSLAHGTTTPVEQCPLPKMIETGKRASSELQIQDGRWMVITVDPIFDENGALIGAVHIARDITKRIENQNERERLVLELKDALTQVKRLSGLLPICSYCKRIRDDKGYWKQIESYIHEHSEAEFSHGICQDCLKKHYPDYDINKVKPKKD